MQSTMVSSEQGQHSRELGERGQEVSVSLKTEKAVKKRSFLLASKTGFDMEIKCLENTVLD